MLGAAGSKTDRKRIHVCGRLAQYYNSVGVAFYQIEIQQLTQWQQLQLWNLEQNVPYPVKSVGGVLLPSLSREL